MRTQEEKYESFFDFEQQCGTIKHSHCLCCRTVSIKNNGVPKTKPGVCTRCKPYKDVDYYLKRHLLPVWYKNGDTNNKPNFRIPAVLACLTQAEKMLIQRVSPFIPLHHIKNGTCGLKGHVCAYEQDINEFIQRLLRRREDTTLLRVVKTIKTEIGSKTSETKKAFCVRKSAVEKALRWLKQNNPLYQDIDIDMSNLDWIEGPTGSLIDNTILKSKMKFILKKTTMLLMQIWAQPHGKLLNMSASQRM